jgi:3-oxoacyl-[acyl-carrier protein] reductase
VSAGPVARTALVTGAAAGFGLATSRRLGGLGHHVVMLDRAPEVAARAEELRGTGARVTALRYDVTDVDGIPALVEGLVAEHGPIQVLVNNAGTGARGPDGRAPDIEALGPEVWNHVLTLNLTAVFLLCRAVLGPMRTASWGRIVNISSRAGRTAVGPSDVSYAASKAGVVGLTRRLALQVAPYGITANAIAPGRFDTALANSASADVIRAATAAIPVGRVGRPEEIAAAVAYLVSEDAGYVTGAVLDVNGGTFMG